MQKNQSEVARLLVDIDEQRRAAQAGIEGYAIVASHEAIIARMEMAAKPVLALFKQGRVEDGIKLWENSQHL